MHQSEILDRIPSELVDMRMAEPGHHVPLLETFLLKFIGLDSFQFGLVPDFRGTREETTGSSLLAASRSRDCWVRPVTGAALATAGLWNPLAQSMRMSLTSESVNRHCLAMRLAGMRPWRACSTSHRGVQPSAVATSSTECVVTLTGPLACPPPPARRLLEPGASA